MQKSKAKNTDKELSEMKQTLEQGNKEKEELRLYNVELLQTITNKDKQLEKQASKLKSVDA